MNRAKALEKVEPAKTALTLTEDLIMMGEQMIGKGMGLENRENTFKKDVTENLIGPAAFEVCTKTAKKLLV